MAQITDGRIIVTNGSQVVTQAVGLDVATDNSLAMTGIVESSPDVFTPGETGHFCLGGGTTSSATTTSLSDTTQAWAVDAYRGWDVWILDGTGAGQVRRILSNTNDTLTLDAAWTTTPDSTSIFVLLGKGTATAGGATTLTDTSEVTDWDVNEWTGYYCTITAGTGVGQTRLIASNTATILTVAAWAVQPDATSEYIISLATAEVLEHELVQGNAYIDPLNGTGVVGNYFVGEASRGGSLVVTYALDSPWITEGVLPNHLLFKNEVLSEIGRSDNLIAKVIESVDSESQVTLADAYAGPSRKNIAYVIHTSLDPDLGIPLPESGDVAIRAIVRQGFLALIQSFKDLASGGAPLSGNGKRSPRVNAAETAFEMVQMAPLDGSDAFTGVPSGPSTDPTADDHLARKKYVDDQAALSVATTGGTMTGALTLEREILLGPNTADSGAAASLTDTSAFTGIDYSSLEVELLTGTGAGQTRGILSNTDDVLTVDTNWATNPDATTTYRIYDPAEARTAAKIQDITDSITTQLNPSRTYQEELGNRTITAAGGLQDLTNLTGISVPGSPDGVKTYRVSFTLTYDEVAAGVNYVSLFLGSTGDSGDTEEVRVPFYSTTAGDRTFSITDFEITPAASDKIGLALDTAADIVVYGGGVTTSFRTWLEIEEVVEA